MWQTTGGMMTTFTTEDRLNASNVPYTTSTGIQMGKYYQKPKYVEYDRDMLLIQSHLIQDPKILRKQYWINVAYYFALFFVVLTIALVNK
jgi:hypothetical protein